MLLDLTGLTPVPNTLADANQVANALNAIKAVVNSLDGANVNPAAVLSLAQVVTQAGDADRQLMFASDGRIYFGAATDTNLYRSNADTLKTDDGLIAAGALATKVTAGSVTDGDVVAGMAVDGAIVGDATNKRLYIRLAGGWWWATLSDAP